MWQEAQEEGENKGVNGDEHVKSGKRKRRGSGSDHLLHGASGRTSEVGKLVSWD